MLYVELFESYWFMFLVFRSIACSHTCYSFMFIAWCLRHALSETYYLIMQSKQSKAQYNAFFKINLKENINTHIPLFYFIISCYHQRDYWWLVDKWKVSNAKLGFILQNALYLRRNFKCQNALYSRMDGITFFSLKMLVPYFFILVNIIYDI